MAKTPAKKAVKAVAAKAAVADKKKKRSHKRTESYGTYIYKVLKQVHPGECVPRTKAGAGAGSARPDRQPGWAAPSAHAAAAGAGVCCW